MTPDVLLQRLLARLGKEGDAASSAGTLHARLEALDALARTPPEGAMTAVPPALDATAAGNQGSILATIGGGYVYGAWTEMIAAGAIATPILVHYVTHGRLASGTSLQVQIGVGAAGAEVVVGEVMSQFFNQLAVLPVSLRVAAGARVALRFTWQATTTTVRSGLSYSPTT